MAGAGDRRSSKAMMKFGVEAARNGLWREAAFRWERALRIDPDNARIHNNLAVAYEGLGRFQEALREYQEAARLDPDSKEIRNNYESFQETQRLLAQEPVAGAASPDPGSRP